MLAIAARVHAACEDATAVASARVAVAAACACDVASHREYTACAGGVVKGLVSAEMLPRGCKGVVKACASHSTCGNADGVTCCRPGRTGRIRCKVTTAERCAKAGGCLGQHASCCDACDDAGCATGTTSSSTVPSTTLPPTTTTAPAGTTTTTTVQSSMCGNGVIEGDEWCDGESFCQGCTIRRHACCEYGTGEDLCAIDVPAVTLYSNQYELCGFYGGTFKMGTVATGTTSCANPPAGAPPVYAGGCGPAPTLPEPVSLCCKLPTCVDQVVTNETELATFVWNCLYANYPSFPVVVGACGVDGSCVPAH